jgi:integrase
MTTESLTLSGNAYDNFVNTIKSEVTLECYNNAIKRFMLYLNITDVNNLLILSKDPLEIQQKIINYILYLKKDKGLSAVSIAQYIACIIHFYAMNDVTLNRKKIGRYIPEHIRKQKDRAYTIQEISRLLEFCDLRNRAIVLLFASTGMRIGAVPALRLEHLTKIEKYNLYQFTVYAGYKEEYICFCTPECAKAIYIVSKCQSCTCIMSNKHAIRSCEL